MEFNPKLPDTSEAFYLAEELEYTQTEERKDSDQDPDLYGIAVTKHIINTIEKMATISFMRPMAPLHHDDIKLEENQVYSAYINYGIFPNAESDREVKYVEGHRGSSGEVVPHDLKVLAAIGAHWMAVSFGVLSIGIMNIY